MTTLVLAKATELASPLLRLIAPAYADVLAALWPAPHAVRHRPDGATAPDLPDAGHGGHGPSVGRRRPAAGGAAAQGRAAGAGPGPRRPGRALERLGEIAWTPEDSPRADHPAGRSQAGQDPAPRDPDRPAAGADPGRPARPLRDAGGVAVQVNAAQAKLLAEAHACSAGACRRPFWPSGSRCGLAPPPRQDLFNLVADDFRRELPKPRSSGTERLRPWRPWAAIRDAARATATAWPTMSTRRSTAHAPSTNGCPRRARAIETHAR